MEQIEVKIKLQTNKLNYDMLIGRSDKIEKLKEYCEKISDIHPDQQILIYKGIILSNEKLISDYNIDNGHNIILKKKEEPSPVNNHLFKKILNNNFSNNNKTNLSNNKELNFDDIANANKQFPDYFSIFKKIDFDKLDDLCHFFGLGKFSDALGIESQNYKKILKEPNPKSKNIINNMIKDPSILQIAFNKPEVRKKIQNNPILKFALQNPQIILSPHFVQMSQNIFKENEKSKIESSNTGISVPPDPFESGQMLNSSGKI